MLQEQQLLKDLTIKDHRIQMTVEHPIMMTKSIMKIQNVIHHLVNQTEEQIIHLAVNLQIIKMIQ